MPILQAGCVNLVRHIENLRKFGVSVVVAVNKFSTDTEEEIACIRSAAIGAGAVDAVMANHWAKGGAGAVELAQAVAKACSNNRSGFKFLYGLDEPLKAKIERVVYDIYRGAKVEYSQLAEKQLEAYEKQGWGKMPICLAKTHLSFSSDPELKGAPTGFTITVREARASVGAGFIYCLLGNIMTIPGL